MKTEIFQSTLPRGERLPDAGVRSLTSDISIHAPTRGATGGKDIIGGASEISIHAPTRGATDECRAWKEKHNAFQSTLPRGERPNCFDHCQGEMDISIHAPTRGATLTDLGYEVQFKISIHAPTRGATDV